MDENMTTLQKWVEESGVPDFRSKDGLYNQCYDDPPETIISHSYFSCYPEKFYQFYREKMIALDAEPNVGHLKLAELEQAGKLKAVLTQNIDGLHQKAGSREVLELHGSVHRNYCMKCGKFYPVETIVNGDGIPWCRQRRYVPGGGIHPQGGYDDCGGQLSGGLSGCGSDQLL